MDNSKSLLSIIQVGPDPLGQGGISAVIEEITAMSADDMAMTSVTTWSRGQPARSLGRACKFAVLHLIGKQRADVVHTHLSERGSFIREGLIVAFACWVRGTPLVATLHGADFEQFVGRFALLTRVVLRRCAVVLCLGPKTEAFLQTFDRRIRSVVVLNPVRDVSDDCVFEKRLTTSPPNPVVLFAGEVGTRKGFDRIVDAWPLIAVEYPSATLVVCGPIAEDYLELDLSKFDYRGVLKRHDLEQAYAEAWVSCLPSRAEVLPMFILESLSHGIPAVVTDAGEMGLLDNCGAVDVLPQRLISRQRLAASIVRLLGDRDELARRSASAILWSRDNTSPSSVRDQLKAVYRIALDG